MKNFFRFVMAAVVLFGAVACSQNQVEEVVGNEEITTTFSVGLENLGTRATTAGTAKMITNVKYGIYDVNANGKYLPISGDVEFDQATGKAEIKVTLFTGKTYDLVFWAYDAANTTAYDVDMENREVTVNYENLAANDESRDAFFHIENGFVAGPSKTFTLKRPFAQLNAGQNQADLDAMAATGNRIVSSYVHTQAYKTLSLVNGGVEGDKVDVNYADAYVIDGETLTVNNEEFKSISMNYLLVDTKDLVNATFYFVGDEGTTFERPFTNVPVQRNYRTNILGQLISAPSVFTIIIDANFEGDHNSSVEYPAEGSLEELLTDEILAQESAQIVLQSDVTWTTGAGHGSTPIIPAGAALKDLVIEGGVVSRDASMPVITVLGNGVGALRAANGGKITFRNVKFVDQSVSYAENSWEFGYLEFAGNLEFENCQFVNAIMVCGETANNNTAGNAKFTNCYFNSGDANQYGVWVSGNNASFEGCTFEGYRGLKTHEDYGSEVETLTVDKCDFTLTKKPGLAIGNVNAQTVITIKNSTFNTQAGDQGLYIYETDTDVTTFTFVLENNTVVATSESWTALVAKDNAKVALPSGVYTLPAVGNNVTIAAANGAEVVLDQTGKKPGLGGKNVTFEGLTIKHANANYCGFQHAGNLVYNNCVIEGQPFLYGASETFNKCTFVQTSADAYNVWTYGAKVVTFNECTFNSAGKSVLVYTESKINSTVTFNDCVLNASAPVEGKAAVEVDSSLIKDGHYTVVFNNTTANGFANGNVSGNSLWNNKKGDQLTVIVDGAYVLTPTPAADANGNWAVKTAAALQHAIANAAAGATITLAEGIYAGLFDLTGKNLTIEAAGDATINGMLWADNTTAVVKGLTLSNPNGVQHPNPTSSKYYTTINNQYPIVGAYNNANVKFENCVFDIVGPTNYGYYGYAHDNPVFKACTFNCNGIRPIANNGDSIEVNGCTFNDQYHYSVRIYENAGERQTVVFTNNTVQGNNSKGEFEGINISKKGGVGSVVFADFTISDNTPSLKYRYNKDVILDASCTGAQSFEKEN